MDPSPVASGLPSDRRQGSTLYREEETEGAWGVSVVESEGVVEGEEEDLVGTGATTGVRTEL